VTSVLCGDPVQEFVRDVTSGRRFQQKEPTMTSRSRSKLRGRMLPIMHPDAAGIDIGAEEIFVAVPSDRDIDSVRRFGTFTRDLIDLPIGCASATSGR
jgi:hypothetical protein